MKSETPWRLPRRKKKDYRATLTVYDKKTGLYVTEEYIGFTSDAPPDADGGELIADATCAFYDKWVEKPGKEE
jgi:hypothetical protein